MVIGCMVVRHGWAEVEQMQRLRWRSWSIEVKIDQNDNNHHFMVLTVLDKLLKWVKFDFIMCKTNEQQSCISNLELCCNCDDAALCTKSSPVSACNNIKYV